MLQNDQMQPVLSSFAESDSINVNASRGIDPMTLVTLNYCLFRSLYSMGTSREKICSAMLLNEDEFDYIVGLIKGQKFRSVDGETRLSSP